MGGKAVAAFRPSMYRGQKKELIEIRRDLGSRRSTIKHNNQPYQRRKRRDRDRRGSATAGECRGGQYLIVLGAVEFGGSREYYKIDALIK